ncbi:hypothetical protein AB1L88_15665 [Tautonia sp. JC769]|uniref:hypothetical protein n=1 Tax=Tautonia sp. JC769 TaxID=3232135 RepID=UPI003458933B
MFQPGAVITFDPRVVRDEIHGGFCLPVNLPPNVSLSRGTLLGQRIGAQNHTFTLSVSDTVGGGIWRLSAVDPLTGLARETEDLDHDISNADLATALEAIYGSGNVAVTGSALPTGPLTITLQNQLAGFPATSPTLTVSALTGGGSYDIATGQVGRSAGTYEAYASLKLANPAAAPTASGTGSAGGYAAGSYNVQVAYETAEGETAGSPVASIAMTSAQQLRIGQITGLSARVTRVNVYVNGNHAGAITPSGGTAAQTDFTLTAGSVIPGKRIPRHNSTGNPRCVLPRTVATDAHGLITLGEQASGYLNEKGDKSITAFFAGTFRTQDLVGLDADAAHILGRMLKGTLGDGLILIF